MKTVPKRKTKTVFAGPVPIGGGGVVVQTMTKTDTRDFAATRRQIAKVARAGAQLCRLAVPDHAAAESFARLAKVAKIPLVADIHFDPILAIFCAQNGAAKIRINPGNFPQDALEKLVRTCRKHAVPIRVGANAGSLKAKPNAANLAAAVLENVAILQSFDFHQIVVAAKSTCVQTTIAANEILSAKTQLPLHLGVTEAGFGTAGICKSVAAIAPLLQQGIGDTIRISLTADPVEEVQVAREILQSLGLQRFSREFISCPTCGRTEVDLARVAREVFRSTKDLPKDLKIAVMGCAVNGPGEAAQADFALVGGKEFWLIFAGGKLVKRVGESGAVQEFLKIIAEKTS